MGEAQKTSKRKPFGGKKKKNKKDRWTSNGLLDGEVRDVILDHLCAFPIALKQHLRGVRSGQEIYSVFEALGVRQSRARAWRPPDRRLHAPLSRSLASPA